MSAAPNSDYQYQVGGSLSESATTYVKRQADTDFCQGLKAGEYCYVLNSRQMGKSSLRVQTMKTLKNQGVACAAIEMRDICSHELTQDEFYGGFVSLLISGFDLEIDVGDWWRKYNYITPSLRLSKFVEEEFLEKVTQNNIVVFVDEIDSVLSLEFKDDFLAFIRSCYNKRADTPKYNRLTFALLGVAAPADLIKDKVNSPYNIGGRIIELTGFQLDRTGPLQEGLSGKVSNPKALLKEVLEWTGGQPFLTQSLCQLILDYSPPIPANGEAECVKRIVRSRMIENWQAQDKQQHFKTISERILRRGGNTARLLELYQQILQQEEIAADDSPEQIELRLSGLVVKQQGKLRVYNRVYASVFDQVWVDTELSKLRPYAEALEEAWVASNYQDKSQLLRGEELQDAPTWAAGRRLSAQNHDSFNASQEAEENSRLPRLHWLPALKKAISLGLLLVPIIIWAVNDKNWYRLHKDGSIWHGLVRLDNNPKNIAIDADGNGLYQLHDSGWIRQYKGKGEPCVNVSKPCLGWVRLDNNPKTIAIDANANGLYQLHNDDRSIWQYSGMPCNNNECRGWVRLGIQELIGRKDFRWEPAIEKEDNNPKTRTQFNFETKEEGWSFDGNAGLDYDRRFEHSGRGNGWVRATSGWNAILNHVNVKPNSNCQVTAWLRTSDTLTDGYISVRPLNSDGTLGNVINEVKLVGVGPPNPQNKDYNHYLFDFNSGSSNKVLFYVGLWGNGRDSLIQVDDVAIYCKY